MDWSRQSNDKLPQSGAAMEKLIPVINKLQDVFNTIGTDQMDLPQIVVVGSQSAGKSSVLESLVGRDFLPRGSGIVTRRPLVLQLINIQSTKEEKTNEKGSKAEKSEGSDKEEWGEFLHKPNEQYYDFNAIRKEIENETDKLTGKNKGISNVPISLKIYSPYVLNLTLVDLPGLTRVPVGDQPRDIERQIRHMIHQYIEPKNSIILAISAANTDLANSDALQLAREVDPHCERTLGVLTKLDIMDKGTDALDMLNGRVIPLKLGFIGVVNRSQQDIISKKSIRQAIQSESEFFNSHPIYRAVSFKCGTVVLGKTLNRILLTHIRETIPELKQKVNRMLQDSLNEMSAYGDFRLDDKNSQSALLLSIITRFSNNYRNYIDGKFSDPNNTFELRGGARINYIFVNSFSKFIDKINPTEDLNSTDIRTAIKNATGPKASLFIPEASFELLVKTQIQKLYEPSMQCVELVFDELQRIVSQLETKELLRFSNLKDAVVDVVSNILVRYKEPTKQMIAHLIEIELAYINTNHPDFVGGDGAATAILEKTAQMQMGEDDAPSTQKGMSNNNNYSAPRQKSGIFSTYFSNANEEKVKKKTSFKDKLSNMPPSLVPAPQSTDKENFEVELIKYLLQNYFDIVTKNIKDAVPKTIMHFLVNQSKAKIQNELVSTLYKDEMISELLEENSVIAQRRENCKNMIQILKQAHEVLNEIRDFHL